MQNKTKYYVILLIIFIAGYLNAYHPGGNLVQYDDPKGHYSIKYPSNWEINKVNTKGMDVIFAPLKISFFEDSVEQFAIKEVENKFKDKAINYKEYFQTFEKYPEMKLLSVKDTTIANLPTKLITYRFTKNEKNGVFVTANILKDSYIYVLMFSCKEGDEEKYSELVNKVFGSFQIK